MNMFSFHPKSKLNINPIPLHTGRYTWICIRWNLQVGAECTRTYRCTEKKYSKRNLIMDIHIEILNHVESCEYILIVLHE